MPIIESAYSRRPYYMLNAHWETVIPSMFFKAADQSYERERLELSDGDFLDIDWVNDGHKQCMIISHGLEGNSDRYYVKRTAKYFRERGWDIAAWNCRSCSGEMNRLARFYHHGDTQDLAAVIDRVIGKGYETIVLFGYSMGGSIALKYLGERRTAPRVRGAVVFSVPCSLRDSAAQLLKKENRVYEQRFLKKLIAKIKIKALTHPEISAERIDLIRDFNDFHDHFTAPLHGFRDRDDFFEKATCDRFLGEISVPVLIVNAENDPMLGAQCYPMSVARQSSKVFLEIPKVGGHCGFSIKGQPHSYMELRAESFIGQHILTSP